MANLQIVPATTLNSSRGFPIATNAINHFNAINPLFSNVPATTAGGARKLPAELLDVPQSSDVEISIKPGCHREINGTSMGDLWEIDGK